MASTESTTRSLEPILPRSRDDLTVRRTVELLLYVLGVITLAWHLYYAYRGGMPRQQHANIHLGLMLSAFYLATLKWDPQGWREYVRNALSVVLLVGAVASTAYVHANFWRWLNEARENLIYTDLDLLIGLTVIVVTIHATWRAYGKLLGLVSVGAMFYGFAGPLFPGILYHGGMSIERIVYVNSVALNGVYGFILGVGATWVAIFILFAGIIEAYGGMEYVIGLGKNIGSRFSSGIVQVAVIASMLMGSITGSSAANVATTGSFTIPLMREEGIEGRFAGAIESIASTGGQILPPVMGSAAFLMADILGVSFFEILRAAILPALLFYVTVAFVVHLAAVKNGWTGGSTALVDERESGPEDRSVVRTLVNTFPYTGPLVVLIVTLVVLRYDPMSAGMYAIVSVVLFGLVRDLVLGNGLSTVKLWWRRTVEGARIGMVNMAPLTAVLASLGIVIRIITQTGFTQRFSVQMISLAGGVFVLVLLLAMAASILFGMGMPTPAAYVVVAILTAPGLVQLGIGPITAHMFVFYFALLSTITPPVALSCAVGAGIAEAKFWDTAKETLRLGLFAFVVPFVFVMNPELIYWNGLQTASTFFLSTVGLLGLGVGIVGYDFNARIPLWQRTIYLVVAAGIFFTPIYSVQLALTGVLLVWLVLRAMRSSGVRLPEFDVR
ncbi:TRAP transporter permease [Halomarina halobia]|uniref:TRAP transporter permease n=1 Tax=Halomarina halobia TaxID=3033386 RepID=A0ABD6AF94_9EURY|nr:TRAP transporter fused permease subunit [Halomarina sp. PSR21]